VEGNAMSKWRVKISRQIWEHAFVVVEAPDEGSAGEKAIDIALESNAAWHPADEEPDAIEVDGVEPAASEPDLFEMKQDQLDDEEDRRGDYR
jgi:hypothetical protein